jgi:hypothetical protein
MFLETHAFIEGALRRVNQGTIYNCAEYDEVGWAEYLCETARAWHADIVSLTLDKAPRDAEVLPKGIVDHFRCNLNFRFTIKSKTPNKETKQQVFYIYWDMT